MTTSSHDRPTRVHPALLSLLPTTLSTTSTTSSPCCCIRVRNDKKMNQLIKFGLTSLRDQPDLPLILHSFPSSPDASHSSTSTSTSTVTDHSSSNEKKKRKKELYTLNKANQVIDSLPKLCSIVEVLKREYVRLQQQEQEEQEREEGRMKVQQQERGLHQYTLLTNFESIGFDTTITTTSTSSSSTQDQEVDDDDEKQRKIELERQELIALNWLKVGNGSGKAGKDKRPKVKHTPCMVVILSTNRIKELDADKEQQLSRRRRNFNFTHQSPLTIPKQLLSQLQQQTKSNSTTNPVVDSNKRNSMMTGEEEEEQEREQEGKPMKKRRRKQKGRGGGGKDNSRNEHEEEERGQLEQSLST